MRSRAPVRPIATLEDRTVKVRKHLLHPPEAWERVVPDLPPSALEALPSEGCPGSIVRQRECAPRRLPEACVRCLLRHHDQHYAPAYLGAVTEAVTSARWGRALGRPGTEAYVDRLGVVVWVDVQGGERTVTTAYRRGPRTGPAWTEREIFERAVLSLRDKTSYQGGGDMDGKDWLAKAAAELDGLLRDPGADPERALILLARLVDGAEVGGPSVPFEALRRKAAWLAAVDLESSSCLDDLADALLDGDLAWAEPLDRLLDVDGRIGLLRLAGLAGPAADLAAHAAALAEVHAESLQAVAPFASVRLATLGSEAPQRALWEAVELAPASVVSAALPARSRRASTQAAWVPREAFAAAAASGEAASWEVREGEHRLGWIEHEDGRASFELLATEEPAAPALRLEAVDADGRVVAARTLTLVREGPRWHADLGAAAGAGSVLQELLASAPGAALRLVLHRD